MPLAKRWSQHAGERRRRMDSGTRHTMTSLQTAWGWLVVLLRRLAHKRERTEAALTRYVPSKMASEVLDDGVWRPSWESSVPTETKKFDVETGEDQKGT